MDKCKFFTIWKQNDVEMSLNKTKPQNPKQNIVDTHGEIFFAPDYCDTAP